MKVAALPQALDSALPLAAEQTADLTRLIAGLDRNGLWWLSGYAAGLAAGAIDSVQSLPPRAPLVQATPSVTIVYGSQTGNARRTAEALHERAQTSGLASRVVRIDSLLPKDLLKERLIYLVISTQGDGDPPEDARPFYDALLSRRAPRLERLSFAVLGLGDSSYPKFCAVAKMLDERLAALGATRLFERGDCDIEIDAVAAPWTQRAVLEARSVLAPAGLGATVTPLRPPTSPGAASGETQLSLEVLANQRITARGALKDVRHIELALNGSGLQYAPGDALAIWPRNDVSLVDGILAACGLSGDAAVSHGGRALSLRDWLLDEREITRIARPFLIAHAARTQSPELAELLADKSGDAFAGLIADHQLLDVLLRWTARWSADDLVASLRPLSTRSYSIASSQKEFEDEIHLTVSLLDYQARGRRQRGAASAFLAGRNQEQALRAQLVPNPRFRLPTDASRDILMIGPGTGVAAFRAFVQERAAVGASGRNWLFFGEQHFNTQFLYQLEWQAALKRGQLHRLDLAFSRDQIERIYVQQRLREAGREVFDWLQSGAHLYVCGDARRMAPDVHEALLDIVSEQRGCDRESAQDYVAELSTQGRYLRDVY